MSNASTDHANRTHASWRFVVLATALSGASALIYEVVASRIFSVFFGSALNSMTTVLITFLGGLALGAGLMTSLQARVRQKRLVFAGIQTVIAFYGVLVMTHFADLPSLLDAVAPVVTHPTAVQFVGGFLFILLPTLLLGAIFPLATALISDTAEDSSRRIGWLYTWDVVGAVLGAAVAGFVLIVRFGNTATIIFAASLNLAAALLLLGRPARSRAVLLPLSALFIVAGVQAYQSRSVFRVLPVSGQVVPAVVHHDAKQILFEKKSPYGTVRIVDLDFGDHGQDRILSIGGRDQCVLTTHGSESLIATGALEGQTGADVLSVGLGCGFTLSSILNFAPSQVVVAEINPVVYDAAQYFRDVTHGAVDDERVEVRIIDGAELIRTTKETYDAVIIDIENPSVAHASPLYTLEYLALAKERLNPGGRLALWAHYSHDERYLKSLVTTLEEVFATVVFADYDVPPVHLLVASDGPLDPAVIDERGEFLALKSELDLIDPVPPNTLDRPTLQDYYRPW